MANSDTYRPVVQIRADDHVDNKAAERVLALLK